MSLCAEHSKKPLEREFSRMNGRINCFSSEQFDCCVCTLSNKNVINCLQPKLGIGGLADVYTYEVRLLTNKIAVVEHFMYFEFIYIKLLSPLIYTTLFSLQRSIGILYCSRPGLKSFSVISFRVRAAYFFRALTLKYCSISCRFHLRGQREVKRRKISQTRRTV